MTPWERFAGPRPLALSDVKLPAILRIAVTAPHPDDVEGIAITIQMLQANGNPVYLAVLTTGVSGVAMDSPARTRDRHRYRGDGRALPDGLPQRGSEDPWHSSRPDRGIRRRWGQVEGAPAATAGYA